jgi:hypothetical protein
MTDAAKPPKKSNIVKKLDSLWSHIIREIYQGKCALCGRDGQCAHHFFGKGSHSATRWDVHNGLWLCFGCHIRKIHQDGNTEPARDALIRRIGLSKFVALKERAMTVCRRRKHEYDDTRRDLESMMDPEIIEALRNEGK